MKIHIGIFFGGKSVEHEVSVITAAQVAAAMDTDKYDIIPVYITKDNEMYTGPDLFTPAQFRDIPALLSRSQRVSLFKEKDKVYLMRYPMRMFRKPFVEQLDLAFPVVHGTNGEDGSLQGLFRLHSLPYVGSDVGASACGMDKWVSKCILQSMGLPVLPGCCIQSAEYYADTDDVVDRIEKLFAYPLMVKPVNLGSSVGISPAHSGEELRYAIELAASFAERILLEPMLTDVREINCAVMGDMEHMAASVCEEPLSTGEILSYQDKYMPGGGPGKTGNSKLIGVTKAILPAVPTIPTGGGVKAGGVKGMGATLRKLPAELDKAKEAEIMDLAQKAFQALHCSGVARVDFLMNKSDEKVYVNEINTIPGSLAFYLWTATGKSFRQLTEDLIQMALKRSRMEERLIWSNEVNILASIPESTKGALDK
ncbi:MAG: D-alanine--D-alanine ligase [Peptococcaceae bacterium]|jgi:D-alanine-D-alanine ligase|nr:D-alanine--D-alanine ligase [Peptococcaceae bacterium]